MVEETVLRYNKLMDGEIVVVCGHYAKYVMISALLADRVVSWRSLRKFHSFTAAQLHSMRQSKTHSHFVGQVVRCVEQIINSLYFI